MCHAGAEPHLDVVGRCEVTRKQLCDLAVTADIHGDVKAQEALRQWAIKAHDALCRALLRTRATSTDYAKELKELTR